MAEAVKPERAFARDFRTLVVLNFIFFLFLASVLYVNSSFLETFMSPTMVSIAFAAGSAAVIAALAALPALVSAVGARRLTLILIPATALAALFLGFSQGPLPAVAFFILQGAGIYALMYLLDLYLEAITKSEAVTGNVRGIFLTSGNLAIFLGPLAIAFFVVGHEYMPLYIFAAAVLIPAFFIAIAALGRVVPVLPRRHSFTEMWAALSHRPSIACVMGAYLLLWIFYSWVVVYAPLLLIQVGGYSWQVAGLITAFALTPFLFMEIPLGIIADRWLGEKEIMAAGFVIMALATAALAAVPLSLVVLWAIVFFATRVGASMVELSTETYFFRQVTENDAALVSLFRMLRSLGFIAGPLIALVLLAVSDLQSIFATFGAILLIGMPLALSIADTR